MAEEGRVFYEVEVDRVEVRYVDCEPQCNLPFDWQPAYKGVLQIDEMGAYVRCPFTNKPCASRTLIDIDLGKGFFRRARKL